MARTTRGRTSPSSRSRASNQPSRSGGTLHVGRGAASPEARRDGAAEGPGEVEEARPLRPQVDGRNGLLHLQTPLRGARDGQEPPQHGPGDVPQSFPIQPLHEPEHCRVNQR